MTVLAGTDKGRSIGFQRFFEPRYYLRIDRLDTRVLRSPKVQVVHGIYVHSTCNFLETVETVQYPRGPFDA
jgi:hypothetical protein